MFPQFSKLLIAQEGITYELFEDTLNLPDGFLAAFSEEEKAKDGVMSWLWPFGKKW